MRRSIVIRQPSGWSVAVTVAAADDARQRRRSCLNDDDAGGGGGGGSAERRTFYDAAVRRSYICRRPCRFRRRRRRRRKRRRKRKRKRRRINYRRSRRRDLWSTCDDELKQKNREDDHATSPHSTRPRVAEPDVVVSSPDGCHHPPPTPVVMSSRHEYVRTPNMSSRMFVREIITVCRLTIELKSSLHRVYYSLKRH